MAQVMTVIDNLSSCRMFQPYQLASQRGFTAAGFTHQPQSLPLVDVEVHVVDRLHMVPDLVEKTAPNWEKGLHPPQLQQHFFLAHTASTSSLCPA